MVSRGKCVKIYKEMSRFFALVLLAGCASSEEDRYYNPNIPAAAYIADSIPIHVAPPIHPPWKPVEFFFKGCEETGVGNHFSKTSYECTYP